MKSRNFLHSNPIETQNSTAKGFLLARSPKADVATTSAVRRFELQHNSSPRFARRRQERRQGQALLLAVLIMLLAALLSAGFLGVVSGNLNQSARIADKTRAIEASRAGIAFANAQLSGSSQGDLWRPVDVSPAPNTTDAGYDFYYSQLDKVQGWANTLPQNDPNYRNTAYGKFPDPNQVASDAPKFLVKVEEIPSNLPTNNAEYEHRSEIKITSIGLSEDDPNVFHRSVAYKVGRKKSPWASALRSISNWNFDDTKGSVGVPFAKVDVVAATGATVATPQFSVDVQVNTRVNNEDAPQFSKEDVPFNVVIVKKDGTPTVRGAVVIDVTPPATGSTVATLKLAKVEAPIVTTEVIQKAAAIGIGSTIDLLNTGTAVAYAANLPQPNGILANGSAWMQGQIQLSDLNKFGTKIFTSGSIALDTASKPVAAPATLPNPNYGIAGNGTLVSSSAGNFPGTFTTDSGADVAPVDLVNDGWNKIGAQTLGLDYSTSRDVEPFTPVKIDSAQNLARYRALTRNSSDGVYIDNRDDVEKVGAAPMSQKQLVEMLTSTVSFPVSPTPDPEGRFYTRNSPAATAAAGVSLEQRHLRGWVGPDEFLARGALVELITSGTTPKIRVTYDSRSDANPNGPESTKTLRDPDTGNPQPGVYSREIDWPSNGTLFAEGNIRIRGNVQLPLPPATGADPFPSLTVVSLNNIYIEGALSLDNSTFDNTANGGTATDPSPNRKKLMLLAKKNVIVNPTRAVISRTDVATVATNTANVTFNGTPVATSTQTLSVANSLLFNKGDYATIGLGQNKSVRGLITNVDLANDQITVVSNDSFVVAATAPGAVYNVRSSLEARDTNAIAPVADRVFFSLVKTENAPGSVENVVNRRINTPLADVSTPGYNKLNLDHVADLKQISVGGADIGFKIEADDVSTAFPRPAPPTSPAFIAELTNKQPLKAGTQDLDPGVEVVRDTDKVLRTYNNYMATGATNYKFFYNPPVAKTIEDLQTDASNTSEQRTTPDEGYKYVASLIDFPEAGADPTKSIKNLPYHALAGVGLRYEPAATDTSLNNRREDFNKPEDYTIPLATSVEIDLNGVKSWARPKSGTLVANYFGFDPKLGETEDALTVDRSFYQTSNLVKRSTLDSRILNLASYTPEIHGTSFVLRPATPDIANPTAAPAFALLPDYRLRALKYENIDLTTKAIKPVGSDIQINAFVYAQEGSWLIIPGDYFRSNPQVRGEKNGAGELIGSYIDYSNTIPTVFQADPGEYILDTSVTPNVKVADLNRNGEVDAGEKEAALRFVRYNIAPIKFYGAIVENQTAVVADVTDASGNTILAKGAVQDWMDKWATYADGGVGGGGVGAPDKFNFISYAYDPSIANNSVGANGLRVPVTDDLLYEQ